MGGMAIEREELINLVYQLQTDLKMLAEYLARTEEPILPFQTLVELISVHFRLSEGTSRRH